MRNVPPQKAAFIRHELENGDDRRKKVALQEVARIYRSGGRFAPDIRNGLELTINGLLSSQQDAKVTRWCLNCIAQMGTRTGSVQSVERTLRQQVGDPEIIAAAVAAAAKLYAGQLDECSALGSVQPEIKTLAALQIAPPSKLDLTGFRILVDTADDEVLKLALITVGLNRAFENMFHPRHSNSELVRALAQHDNRVLKQYSVWSVIENTGLSIDDLGIPFSSLDGEARDLKEQIRLVEMPKQDVVVTHAWAVRTDQVQMEVMNNSPDILHFSGHGDTGILCFEDKNGNVAEVSAAAIEGLVKLSDSIECLVLNACHSESVAMQVKAHVKAVIGCTVDIDDDAAIAFTRAFYRALRHGHPLRRAYDLALNELQLNGMENEAKKYIFIAGGA